MQTSVSIELLIEQKMDEYILSSSYSTLRHSCIMLAPIHEVLTETQKALNQELTRRQNVHLLRFKDTSYVMYLNRLKLLLSGSRPLLSPSEKEALEQITHLMCIYQDTKANEQKEKENRNQASRAKEELQHQWHEKRNKLKKRQETPLNLELQNQQLEQKNKLLAQSIKARNEYKNTLLKMGGFGILFTGAALSGAFLAMYLLPLMIVFFPAFFVPAGVTSFISIGIFIAALAYTIENNIEATQLSHNELTRQDNQERITVQKNEISSIENTLLDEREKINQVEKTITALDQKIQSLQQQAAHLYRQAKTLVVQRIENQSFFTHSMPSSKTSSPTKQSTVLVEANTKTESSLNCLQIN